MEGAAAEKKVTLRNFMKLDMVTPEKTDINNNGGFSTRSGYRSALLQLD